MPSEKNLLAPQTAQAFLTPLNACGSLVCGESWFGPIHVKRGVIDSGCSTTLVPWPDDVDVLRSLLQAPDLTFGVSLSGSVGGNYATLTLLAPDARFEVVLAGHDINVKLDELRFPVTAEARDFLEEFSPGIFSGFMEKHVHQENLNFALVGQSVLARVLTLQVFNKGLLWIPADCPHTNLDALKALSCALFIKETTDEGFQDLKDLRFKHNTRFEQRRSPKRLGPGIDIFGVDRPRC